jgi:hypothetical protein
MGRRAGLGFQVQKSCSKFGRGSGALEEMPDRCGRSNGSGVACWHRGASAVCARSSFSCGGSGRWYWRRGRFDGTSCRLRLSGPEVVVQVWERIGCVAGEAGSMRAQQRPSDGVRMVVLALPRERGLLTVLVCLLWHLAVGAGREGGSMGAAHWAGAGVLEPWRIDGCFGGTSKRRCGGRWLLVSHCGASAVCIRSWFTCGVAGPLDLGGRADRCGGSSG